MSVVEMRPPTLFLVLVVATLIVGVLVIAGSIWPSFDPSLTIAYAPTWLTWWIGSLTTLGAVWTTLGLRWKAGSRAWHAQQVGTLMMMGGYTSYAGATLVVYPQALVHTTFALSAAVMAVVRLYTLAKLERVALSVLDDADGT